MRKVSIVIATYNRSEDLKATLEGLKKQKVNGNLDYEVLIVDNKSTDETKNVVDSFAPDFKDRLRYLYEPRQGKSNALNKGIREARGDIIAFTDDDVQVTPDWLSKVNDCFEKNNCDGIGGRVLPVYPDDMPRWMQEEDKHKLPGIIVTYDAGDETQKYSNGMAPFIGANCAYKREVFEQCGAYREDMGPGKGTTGEDTEFFRRVLSKNKNLFYCAEALVWHPVYLSRASFKKLVNWHVALGRASARHEYEKEKHDFKFICNVPIYLIKGVLVDFCCIPLSLFNPGKRFLCLRRFLRKVGMIIEYRENYRKFVLQGEAHAKG